MTRLTLRLIFIVTAALTLLMAVSMGLGRLQPSRVPGLTQGCEGNPRPCWYGILPGVTSMKDADSILHKAGFVFKNGELHSRSGWSDYIDPLGSLCVKIVVVGEQVRQIAIDGRCSKLQLGDVILLLGEPSGIGPYGMIFFSGEIGVYMEFMPEKVTSDACFNFNPYGQINNLILYDYKSLNVTYSPAMWRGFLPYRFYINRYGVLSCGALSIP